MGEYCFRFQLGPGRTRLDIEILIILECRARVLGIFTANQVQGAFLCECGCRPVRFQKAPHFWNLEGPCPIDTA
jgi:hypothetical protein